MGDLGDVLCERPRYEGESIVNLMASLSRACGADSTYAPLDTLDQQALRAARHLVLLVVDGLGYEFLCSVQQASVMRSHLARSLTSVFPPTTAAAVTAFLTGLAPQQHGLTGWFMYMRELGTVVSVLPFKTRLGGAPLAAMGITPQALFGHVPVFDAFRRGCFLVSPSSIAGSPFNTAHSGQAAVHSYPSQSLEGLFLTIERTLDAAVGPAFVYAYWSELDHMAHAQGIGHPDLVRHVVDLDRELGRFLARLQGRDVMVLVTADHGFVDVPPSGLIQLAQHPALKDALMVPLCGEPRSAYCYTLPSRRAAFARYVQAELAHCAVCVSSQELLERGYFGLGAPHPELANRIGDYTLLMRDGYALADVLPGERRSMSIGVHGGGSAAELRVPLIVAAP